MTRIGRITVKNRGDITALVCIRGVIENGEMLMAGFRSEGNSYALDGHGGVMWVGMRYRRDDSMMQVFPLQ